jgi:hypothetical protein
MCCIQRGRVMVSGGCSTAGRFVSHVINASRFEFSADFLKCVCFVGYQMADGSYRMAGSAFMVAPRDTWLMESVA